MQHSALLAAAKELHAIHGILPVAASGKTPMGGSGWNMLPLATRLLYFSTPGCTGLGFQCGPVFHPFYGPVDARVIDVDEKDEQKRYQFVLMFLHLFGPDAVKIVWRWGRGPACLVFTRGEHTREKYGSIQFLGPGKYAVGWGAHPDVGQYRWPDGDIFKVMPPLADVKKVEACILAACAHAGIVVAAEVADIKLAPEITEQQLGQLSDDDLARYRVELTDVLAKISGMAANTGRGTALYDVGLRFGALARHDARFGDIVNRAIATLPGSTGQGDVRDFTRGLGESKGLAQQTQASRNAQRNEIVAALKPKGVHAPGQELGDLMQENIPALRWLIERYLPHVGTLSLVGKPKIGKSWIVLEAGLSIAEGGTFWGERCNASGVLMYMLEDGKRRMKSRVQKLRPGGVRLKKTFRVRYGKDGPFRVNPDGSGGLLDDIKKHKHDFPDIGIVFIDMWKLIRGSPERGLDAYQATSQLVAPIAALAQELDIAIIIVHHARKGKIDADDISDAASGSNALAGATEGSWTIWRDADGARIVAEVRDSENFDMQLVKGEGEVMWNPVAAETASIKGGTKERIFIELRNAGCELSAADIADRLRADPRTVTARLNDLRSESKIQQHRRGLYCMAGASSRNDGIVAALMRSGVVKPATTELRALHDPDGKNSHLGGTEATGFAFTEEVATAIEAAGFANGSAAVKNLDVHKLVHERKGVVWFFGAGFEVNRAMQPLPWAVAAPKFPWSK